MSEFVSLRDPTLHIPYIGTGTIKALLVDIAREDIVRSNVDPKKTIFSEVEIDTSEAEDRTFLINLWEPVISDHQAPGRLLKYDFVFTVEPNPSKILDATLAADSGLHRKLTRPQALFFAGLSFRALAIKNHALNSKK